MRKTVLILLWMILAAGSAFAHAIDHRVSDTQAKVVEVFFADGRAFSFENFEVTGPKDRSPFLIGRTDKLGRVVFVPDRPGEWSVKVWSEDGHGLQTTVLVADPEASPNPAAVGDAPASAPLTRHLIGLAAGLVLICALGVVLTIQSRRKQP